MFGFSRSYATSCIHSLPQHQAVTNSDSIRLKQVINNNYTPEKKENVKVLPEKPLRKVA